MYILWFPSVSAVRRTHSESRVVPVTVYVLVLCCITCVIKVIKFTLMLVVLLDEVELSVFLMFGASADEYFMTASF